MDEPWSALLARLEPLLARVEAYWPAPCATIDWRSTVAAHWRREGRTGYLQPLKVDLALRLQDLQGIERARDLLQGNTRQFLAGLPANHALLWGARGTGKSSLVRALLAEYADAGLRLIEVEREHLADLPRLVEGLGSLEQRFVVFCDDLSFDAGDSDYRTLKTVLDGSLEQAPENVLLYATSNRRHLLPDRQSDNQGWQQIDGEVHPSEAVEERIALSDRFGLWLSFYAFDQDQYLQVVRHWLAHYAQRSALTWQWDETLEREAIRWASSRGNRNGRCASQFARSWVGRQKLQS